MDGKRAQAIRAALTPKRGLLFDMMCGAVAAGTWTELEDGRRLITIRWQCERKTPDIIREHSYPQATWTENVFVGLTTTTSAPSLRRSVPWVTARDSDLTVTKALAVVADPVVALGLAPVPALLWRLAWAPGTRDAGYEPLTWATEAEVLPERYTEAIVPGHAARHAVDDGLVALDRALNPVTCRYCHSTSIPGRDVLFHPAVPELTEQVPSAPAG